MTKTPRAEDPRYAEVVEHGAKKYVRDQAVLADEIMSLLGTHRELCCNRIALLIGAGYPLVERALGMLMDEGRVTRTKRRDSGGRLSEFWSASTGTADQRVQFNGASILTAFQRTSSGRS
ncbi:hypothetical protein [Paraburkholderia heleia]|uniref:hypothetical protein n=1 Tax=Paraburkholderia heleia TaxID=634127 RepID=UPI002AB788DE|nr:hypothetical protein [Paraburkholderia heleia]